MPDRNMLGDQYETPEDVATLYSWANLHGAKYRDFSASRAQTREKARQRVQDSIDADRRRAREEAEAAMAAEAAHAAEAARAAEAVRAAEAARAAEAERVAEIARQTALRQQELAAQQAAQQLAAQLAAKQAEQLAAQQAAQLAAQQAAWQAELAAQRAAQEAAERAAQQAAERAAQLAAQKAAQEAEQQRAWQQQPDRFSAPPAQAPTPASTPASRPFYPPQPQPFDYPGYTPSHASRPAASQPQYPPMYDDSRTPSSSPWGQPESRETSSRPAWLSSERRADIPSPPAPHAPLPLVPDDTLQGSRDRMASRWFALRSVFEGLQPPVEAAPAPVPSRAPAMAVFSLAGGVGKTSLVATLGRALSARGERVLLIDTAAFGLLPFYFGARDQRPGQLRTFTPPGSSGDAPIQMVAIDPEALSPDAAGQEPLIAEIGKYSRGVSRVIVDLATASGATTRRVMRLAPIILVPIVPDMNSVVSVSSIDAFFQHNGSPGIKPTLPYYVHNQFDSSLPLHLDVREVMREQLGDRLLPFSLRRAPAVSEALAEGMTVIDYAPNSTVTEDFGSLAGWVKGLSAPASSSYRGVRWSER